MSKIEDREMKDAMIQVLEKARKQKGYVLFLQGISTKEIRAIEQLASIGLLVRVEGKRSYKLSAEGWKEDAKKDISSPIRLWFKKKLPLVNPYSNSRFESPCRCFRGNSCFD